MWDPKQHRHCLNTSILDPGLGDSYANTQRAAVANIQAKCVQYWFHQSILSKKIVPLCCRSHPDPQNTESKTLVVAWVSEIQSGVLWHSGIQHCHLFIVKIRTTWAPFSPAKNNFWWAATDSVYDRRLFYYVFGLICTVVTIHHLSLISRASQLLRKSVCAYTGWEI